VAGFPTRRVETPRDDDGLRASLATPAYTLSYGYTWRGQLRTISFANGTQWFSYIYDLAGNLTKRQDILNGVNDSTNVMDANSVSQYECTQPANDVGANWNRERNARQALLPGAISLTIA